MMSSILPQARKQERLRELELQEEREQNLAHQDNKTKRSSLPRVSGWFRGWLGGHTDDGKSSARHELTPEQQQKLRAARRLQRVDKELGPLPAPPQAPKGVSGGGGKFEGGRTYILFGASATPPPFIHAGLYLWGSVGSGKVRGGGVIGHECVNFAEIASTHPSLFKSLLMDMFYEAVSATLPALQRHRRLHFNAAMLEVRQGNGI